MFASCQTQLGIDISLKSYKYQYNLLHILISDATSELEKLEKGHAVGDATHRVMLREAIEEFRASLAETLFCWAAQNPLPSSAVLKVTNQ